MNLTSQQITTLAMGAAAALAVWKFAPNASVKAAALGVVGVMVAKQLPILSDALV